MSRPQQPELAHGAETGQVPPENQPGHHPPEEQDKPDLDAFAARFGGDPESPAKTAPTSSARHVAAVVADRRWALPVAIVAIVATAVVFFVARGGRDSRVR